MCYIFSDTLRVELRSSLWANYPSSHCEYSTHWENDSILCIFIKLQIICCFSCRIDIWWLCVVKKTGWNIGVLWEHCVPKAWAWDWKMYMVLSIEHCVVKDLRASVPFGIACWRPLRQCSLWHSVLKTFEPVFPLA
jgi:hypothetical protein